MKQYFLKGMNEPLKFSDIIEFDFVKKGPDGQAITKHIQCQFLPGLIPLLLDEDVIEVKDVEDNPEESKDENPDSVLDAFIDRTGEFISNATDCLQTFNERITALEQRMNGIAAQQEQQKGCRHPKGNIRGCFFSI